MLLQRGPRASDAGYDQADGTAPGNGHRTPYWASVQASANSTGLDRLYLATNTLKHGFDVL